MSLLGIMACANVTEGVCEAHCPFSVTITGCSLAAMRLGVLCLLDLCVLQAQHIVGIQYLFTVIMNIDVYFVSPC